MEQLEVELPESLIQQEVRNLVEQTAGQFAQQGMDVKSLFTPELVRNLMESSRPEAEERLRRSLALTALAESEKLSVDDADLNAKLKEVKGQLSGERDIDLNASSGRARRSAAGEAPGLAGGEQHGHRKSSGS